MRLTQEVRVGITGALLEEGENAGVGPPGADIEELRRARLLLEQIPRRNGRGSLTYHGKPLFLDLSYEIGELEKDLVYLDRGEDSLLGYLAEMHPELPGELEEGRAFLAGGPPRFHSFVTDRDGTVNNYCGRYYSSVQSAYNAVFLTRFARRRCRRAVILTSAPLQEGGLLRVSVVPAGSFVLAGSKGREALDEGGRLHRMPISVGQRERLEELNQQLAGLVRQPEFEIFGLVGSGLQLKFGQSTVAHQDLHGSIPQDLSRRFREAVYGLIQTLDPQRNTFRTEDTGKDLEILLTVEDGGGKGLRDFDKGDGVRYLDQELGLELATGPNLVCGDTPSDLPMVEAAVRAGGETWSVFVTRDADLRKAVRRACPRSWFVSEPDVLVALLAELGREKP